MMNMRGNAPFVRVTQRNRDVTMMMEGRAPSRHDAGPAPARCGIRQQRSSNVADTVENPASNIVAPHRRHPDTGSPPNAGRGSVPAWYGTSADIQGRRPVAAPDGVRQQRPCVTSRPSVGSGNNDATSRPGVGSGNIDATSPPRCGIRQQRPYATSPTRCGVRQQRPCAPWMQS